MQKEKLYEGIRKVKQDIKKLNNNTKSNIIILIAGGSASGKTSLIAKRIIAKYKKESVLLSMDNYYIGAEFVKKNKLTFDEPHALDLPLFFKHLKELKSGKDIHSPVYNFKTGERTDKYTKISAKKIIVVEGLFALHESIVKLGDYKIFVDLGTHGRILRRIFRDVDRTGDKAGEILNYFSKVVEPKNTEHIEPTKKNADIIIENNYIPFIESRATKIKETQLKYRVAEHDFDDLGQRINRMGGFYVGELVETDYFMSTKGKSLTESDEIMRIRNLKFGKFLLSYRGPKAKNKLYEKRYGINFFIDYETLSAFKKIYGSYEQVLIKKRQNYFINGLIVSLDLFENGEKYLDFRFEEGEHKAVISEILERLGIDEKLGVKESYFEIIK
ncbi:CYTH domain-containing protein [Candidatus Gracilibacteria bacterium]|nr:CYTH domain-containing protein [Candidatus Gracilibacteria bacterium]